MAEKQGKPMDISLIYIEDPFLKRILEEEIDLKTYFETLLSGNYKEYHARVHIIHPISNMMKKVNMRDVAFYSGMSYLLIKSLI